MNDFLDDKHLAVCQLIEEGLKQAYENNPGLTDLLCINGLDNAKVAVKKEFGFAKNERVSPSPETVEVIAHCVAIGLERIDKVDSLSLKEYLARIDKIKRSVRLHSADGRRGYYEFIKKYV